MINALYNLLNSIGYHHPVHPTNVHMPIGLVVGAFVFAVVAFLFRRQKLTMISFYCLLLAFLWIFPTIALGIIDWLHFYNGAWITPIKVKLVVAPTLVLLLAAAIFLGHKYGPVSIRVMPFYILCLCAVTVLGYFGGALTFNGRTIQGPPQYQAGQQIYSVNCAACHPGGGNSLQPDKPIVASPLTASQQMFEFWIRHPASPMPAFSEAKLPPDKLQALYEYVSNVMEKK